MKILLKSIRKKKLELWIWIIGVVYVVFNVGDENSGKLDAEMNTKAMESWSQTGWNLCCFLQAWILNPHTEW